MASAGLDRDTLAQAIRIVQRAFVDTQRPMDDRQFAIAVAAVYEFYIDNASGAGAETLVNALIGATA